MMTWFCSVCVTCWAPYMAIGDGCPECGTGLRRSHEPMDRDAEVRFKAAMRKLRARDEARHEARLRAEARRQRESLAELEAIAALPVAKAFLRCEGCGWAFPLETTDEHERCTECGGRLLVAHEPEQHGEAA